MDPEAILAGITLVLALGAAAQWLGWRIGVPAILLLLAAGFLAGPVGGVLEPDELFGDLLSPVVGLAVGIILFEGGLSLRLAERKLFGSAVQGLISVGVVITLALVTLLAYLLLDLPASLAFLLGAILVVSGPTVVGPLLEFVQPERRVESTLRWESILIDPIGATIGVLIFHGLVTGEFHREQSLGNVLQFTYTITLGALIGGLMAAGLTLFLSRGWIPRHLENVLTLALVASAYTLAEGVAAESGLMATTVMGFVLANQRYADVARIVEFKENLRVLLISSLFVILSARLKLDEVTAELDNLGLYVFFALLVLLVRPLAVLASTARAPLSRNEKIFLAWMAPRGIIAAATASTFALALVEQGHPDAERLIPLTFLTIVVLATLYGLTALPVARWLGVKREESG
jgi:NhaP-type Na+/H+ or K+/H+ antiporter